MALVKDENLERVYPVIATYSNGSSFYRIYADGWCEQGGVVNNSVGADAYPSISLLKTFKNTDYLISNNIIQSAATKNWGSGACSIRQANKTTSSFELVSDGVTNCVGFHWTAKGYLLEGQY